jgi:BirA family biotin operon repressor/biotin-[acetyl-CoA-carboxylase] ligase
MSLRVGLALARTLDQFVSAPVLLKWPNDLMFDDRKLGGILCEARWQGHTLGWVAVGVGVNVRNSIPAELQSVATSLAAERPDIRTGRVLDTVVRSIREVDLCAPRLSADELDQFSSRHWLGGREIREPVGGTVAHLESDGTLQVRVAEGSFMALRNATIELAAVTPTR